MGLLEPFHILVFLAYYLLGFVSGEIVTRNMGRLCEVKLHMPKRMFGIMTSRQFSILAQHTLSQSRSKLSSRQYTSFL